MGPADLLLMGLYEAYQLDCVVISLLVFVGMMLYSQLLVIGL